MSIFKETFQDFVFNQLKIREAALNQNSNRLLGRPKATLQNGKQVNLPAGAFYTNTTSRQCVIRMSSGVDLVPENKLLDEHDANFRPKDMVEEGLAIRYMLEGGIPSKDIDFINNRGNNKGTPENPIKIIPRGRGTRQFTRGTQDYGSTYGDPYIRSDAKDGYGIVPMPGIIDAEIRTKTAYGSLRDAKINFVCHNRRQLDILDALYMRPGMPILLEWGWDPYINNEGKRESYFPYLWEWFDKNQTINKLNSIIHQRINISGGNYDGFIGYVKNFEISSRPDGGYDCTTELAAMGEVLEGLKGRSSGLTIEDSDNKEYEVDNLEYYLDALFMFCETRYNYEQVYLNRDEVKIPQLNNIQTNIIPLIDSSFEVDILEDDGEYTNDVKTMADPDTNTNRVINSMEASLDKYLLYKTETLTGTDKRDIARENISGTKSTKHYIKWELLAQILNKLVFDTYQETSQTENISPLTEITWTDETYNSRIIKPLQYSKYDFNNNQTVTFPRSNEADGSATVLVSDLMDLSVDPSICLLPHQIGSIDEVVTEEGLIWDSTKEEFISNNSERNISDIFISLDYLLKLYRRTRYKGDEINEDFNLFTFLQTIWEKDINNACANTHEFTIHTEKSRGNLIRIIDLKQNMDLDPATLYEFKPHGKESIVRDFNYNTTIDSKLSATVSIASQSPDAISDLDAVSFAAFNRNIKYRFFKEPTTESNTNRVKKADRFNKDIETLKTMLAFLYEYKLDVLKGNFMDDDEKLQTQVAKRYIQTIESKIISLKSRYSKSVPSENIYKGYRKKPEHQKGVTVSTVIPLKFNAKIDGIGGLVIGNVFKIKKEFLPKGYDQKDIAFAIMSENQTITAGQDWTTDFSGQMLLLNLPGKREDWDDIIWSTPNTTGGRSGDQPSVSVQPDNSAIEDSLISPEQQIPDPDLPLVSVSDQIFLKVTTPANVRTTPLINDTFDNPFDFNDNIVGTIQGEQGSLLGIVLEKSINPVKQDVDVTSGNSDYVLSYDDKMKLGWSKTTKDGVNYELVDEDADIKTSQILTPYNNKLWIPEGVLYSFNKEINWVWFLIKFDSPEKIDTSSYGNDNLLNGNAGWMREDVLCSKLGYTTPTQ